MRDGRQEDRRSGPRGRRRSARGLRTAPRPPTPERRAHARAPSGCAQLKCPTDHDWNDSFPRLRAPTVPRRRRHGRRSGAHVAQGRNGSARGRNGSAASPPLPPGVVVRRAGGRAGGTEACRRRRCPTCAGGRGSAASACTHMPHVARHNQVMLVVEVQLAERHVRSRACHVDVEVARTRTAVRGGHAAKNRLAEGT